MLLGTLAESSNTLPRDLFYGKTPKKSQFKHPIAITLSIPESASTMRTMIAKLMKPLKRNPHWLEIIVSPWLSISKVKDLKLFKWSLLDCIDFGTINWAYFTPNWEGGYTIVRRERPMPKITCSLWAPLIFEEVDFTVWGTKLDRRRSWKGKEVG